MGRFEIAAPKASGEAIFSGFTLKWLSDAKMDKMVTRGGLSIHLQEALKLSKEWGEGQSGSTFYMPTGACIVWMPRYRYKVLSTG